MKYKKTTYYITVFLIASLPFLISMFLTITENQSKMLLFTVVILLLIVHIPIISKFEAWGVSVELKQQLQDAQVTIRHLNETLTPLVEELYALATDQGRYINAKTDDSNTPLADLATQLDIYDSDKIKQLRLRMYTLGIHDAFNRIRVLPLNSFDDDEFGLRNECIKNIDEFKSKYEGNLVDYPSNEDIDEFYLSIRHNKYMDLKSLNQYKEVQTHQRNLIDNI